MHGTVPGPHDWHRVEGCSIGGARRLASSEMVWCRSIATAPQRVNESNATTDFVAISSCLEGAEIGEIGEGFCLVFGPTVTSSYVLFTS